MSDEKVKIERLIMPDAISSDDWQIEGKRVDVRPKKFADYPGQTHVKENLKVYVEAAKRRGEPLDHVLLHGPPGLGKTTLAHIIANELGVAFHSTSGPSIEKSGDLAGLLAALEPGSLLFIDEIHRLSIQVEEVLYSAMEDFVLDIIVGQGPTARTVRMPINSFTLVGATTKASSLSRPLMSRFGIQERLEFYDTESLEKILQRSAKILGVDLHEDGAKELSTRSRGTPRIGNRLLRRVWDFALVESSDDAITSGIVNRALKRLDIDQAGLDRMDRRILKVIEERYSGGPVGLETLAVTLGEDKSTVEEVFEPYLVHQGFLTRGPRGRSISLKAKQHLESSH